MIVLGYIVLAVLFAPLAFYCGVQVLAAARDTFREIAEYIGGRP